MKTRIMQRSDLNQVLKLAAQLGYDLELAQIEARFLKIDSHPEHGLFVAALEENIIGWIHMNVEASSLLGEERADVAGLVVDEKHRSLGVGKALLAEGEKWAVQNKLPLIRVRTNTKRVDAHRFYEREGYKIEKSWHLFTKEMPN